MFRNGFPQTLNATIEVSALELPVCSAHIASQLVLYTRNAIKVERLCCLNNYTNVLFPKLGHSIRAEMD